jgi:hypothetical protein
MEKIGNVGWFITNEECNIFKETYTILKGIFGDDNLTINQPTPNTTPWKNPADWTWRPWQAPWYGEGPCDPPYPGDYTTHQPYCTCTTEHDSDATKEIITNSGCNCKCKCEEKEK